MTRDRRATSDRILERLRDLVERHSTSAEISRQLGWPENSLARFFNRELRFSLRRVEEVLHVLDLPLRWFLDWCLEDQETAVPQQVLSSLCVPGGAESDPFLVRLLALADALWDRVDQQEDCRDVPVQVGRIDELRPQDRAQALSLVESHLESMVALKDPPSGCASELACALGVWATIQRTLEHHAAASGALVLALDVCDRFDLEITTSRILQRSSYLLYNCGEPRQALQFTERALLQFALKGCRHDTGRCLVDRGIVYHHLLDHQRTISSCREALEFLPDWDWRNRSTAYQFIAEASLRVGRLDDAAQAADTALKALSSHGLDTCVGHAHWVKARVCARCEEDDRAIDHYREALAHLISGGAMSVDIALVALGLARVFLVRGDLAEMRELASQIQAISPMLRSSPIADSVLMEFVRVARYGEVTAVFLADSQRQLTSATRGRAADE